MLTVSDNHIVLGGGSTTFAGLSDKETADLPGTNTPLANALSGKEASANKKTDVDANKTSDTFFPSVKAVFDWVSGLFVKGVASSTDNAIARFDGTTGKLVQNSLVTISDNGLMKVGIGIANIPNGLAVVGQSGEVAIQVRADGSAATDSSMLFLNAYGNSFGLRVGSLAMNSNRFDLVVDVNGARQLCISVLTNKFVGLNIADPTAQLDVNGTSRIRGSVTLDGQIIDNAGSSGTDGQVLKKVGGQVLWANP